MGQVSKYKDYFQSTYRGYVLGSLSTVPPYLHKDTVRQVLYPYYNPGTKV